MTRIPAAQIHKAVPTGHTIPFTASGRAHLRRLAASRRIRLSDDGRLTMVMVAAKC